MHRTPLLFVLAALPLMGRAQSAEPADSLTLQLREAVVSARQPATRLAGTTLVTTVAGTDLQRLDTGRDVLARLPLVTVSDEGISVTGRGTPEVYIDGRPMRDAEELVRLQAADIRRVEVDMAPGAAHESTTQAVIRIVTRRHTAQGLSLTDRAELSVRRRTSASNLLDLNMRLGAWDVFASATAARHNSLVSGSTRSTLSPDPTSAAPTVVGSSQRSAYPSTVATLCGGFNFSRGRHSAGGYWRYNPEHARFANDGTEWLDDEVPAVRTIAQHITAHSHLATAYLDDTLRHALHLHLDATARSTHSSRRTSTAYPASGRPDIRAGEARRAALQAIRLTLDRPLWHGRLEAGGQFAHTHTRLDYRMEDEDVSTYIPSSLTATRQTTAAAFASWSHTLGRLSLRAGLRYEFADYRLTLNRRRDNDASRTDHVLTPDLALTCNFRPDASLTVSYRRTHLRPPYAQLTGSLTYTGSHEIEGGNPALRDERMHDAGLIASWRDFVLQASLTRSKDTYGFVKQVWPAPTLQLAMRPVNLDLTALYANLVWHRRIGLWTPTATAGIYRQWLTIGTTTHNRPIVSYVLKNSFSLPRDFLLTVDAYGRTAGDMHTNRFGTTALCMDASLSREFMHKALSVKLSATDILGTANHAWRMNTYGILVDKQQRYDQRGVMLHVSYRLRPHTERYKGRTAAEEEQNRL